MGKRALGSIDPKKVHHKKHRPTPPLEQSKLSKYQEFTQGRWNSGSRPGHPDTKEEQQSGANMLSYRQSRCWKGYKPTPGKKPYSKGSCRKK